MSFPVTVCSGWCSFNVTNSVLRRCIGWFFPASIMPDRRKKDQQGLTWSSVPTLWNLHLKPVPESTGKSRYVKQLWQNTNFNPGIGQPWVLRVTLDCSLSFARYYSIHHEMFSSPAWLHTERSTEESKVPSDSGWRWVGCTEDIQGSI